MYFLLFNCFQPLSRTVTSHHFVTPKIKLLTRLNFGLQSIDLILARAFPVLG